MNQKKKVQNKKQKFAALAMLSLCLSTTIGTPSARADELQGANGGPQDMVIDFAKETLSTFLTDSIKDMLFPEQGVDYERIKRDMEQVVQKQIVSAEIDKAIGYINGASANAATAVLRTDAVEALDGIRTTLVHDVSVLATGQFKNPALGNYVQGAQTEAAILAAMLTKVKATPQQGFLLANGEVCDRACVIGMTKLRLDAHSKHVTASTNEVLSSLIQARADQVDGCTPDDEYIMNPYTGKGYVIHHGDQYHDRKTGYTSDHFKDNRAGCNKQRGEYIDHRKTEARNEAYKNLSWLMTARASWTGALVAIQPNLSAADKTALVMKGFNEAGPYIGDASGCYGIVGDSIKRSPGIDTCQTMRDATKVYSYKCDNDFKTFVQLLGCGEVK